MRCNPGACDERGRPHTEDVPSPMIESGRANASSSLSDEDDRFPLMRRMVDLADDVSRHVGAGDQAVSPCRRLGEDLVAARRGTARQDAGSHERPGEAAPADPHLLSVLVVVGAPEYEPERQSLQYRPI